MASNKVFVVLLLIHSSIFVTHAQKDYKFFRKDYTFLAKSLGFYKIHTIHRTWQEAKRTCALEGANFFFPEDENEADSVLAFWNETQPFSWLYIGVSDHLVKGAFTTIDGRDIADVYNKWGPGEPDDVGGIEDCVVLRRDGSINDHTCDGKKPFICKKALADLKWNSDCNIPNTDYIFNGDLKKCYKLHLTPKNWTEAFLTCRAEQSYLAIVESQAEANYLVNLTAQTNKDGVTGDYLRGAVALGFHNRDGEGWKTIRGTPLANSGYSIWGNQQPDGGASEPCGSMFYNGQYNDIACSTNLLFICEHDMSPLDNDIDIDIRYQ